MAPELATHEHLSSGQIFGRLLLEVGPKLRRPADTAVALDDALAERVGTGSSAPAVRIWRNRRVVVLPRSRLAGLDNPLAVDRRGREWSIVARSSGGSAVAHGPGTLNMSLILSRRRGQPQLTIEAGYRLWINIFARMLSERYGLAVDVASVRGAFCSGKFDAVVDGRKVAGVAQARRKRSIVIHGTILTSVERANYLSAVESAEQVVGFDSTANTYDPESIVSLHELTGKVVPESELAWELGCAAVGGSAASSQRRQEISRRELQRAHQIAQQCTTEMKRRSGRGRSSQHNASST
jgi:octanoyl-[GcvH]:protein N-octanoyltransferase